MLYKFDFYGNLIRKILKKTDWFRSGYW